MPTQESGNNEQKKGMDWVFICMCIGLGIVVVYLIRRVRSIEKHIQKMNKEAEHNVGQEEVADAVKYYLEANPSYITNVCLPYLQKPALPMPPYQGSQVGYAQPPRPAPGPPQEQGFMQPQGSPFMQPPQGQGFMYPPQGPSVMYPPRPPFMYPPQGPPMIHNPLGPGFNYPPQGQPFIPLQVPQVPIQEPPQTQDTAPTPTPTHSLVPLESDVGLDECSKEEEQQQETEVVCDGDVCVLVEKTTIILKEDKSSLQDPVKSNWTTMDLIQGPWNEERQQERIVEDIQVSIPDILGSTGNVQLDSMVGTTLNALWEKIQESGVAFDTSMSIIDFSDPIFEEQKNTTVIEEIQEEPVSSEDKNKDELTK